MDDYEVIGTVKVTWVVKDLKDAFEEMFNRLPTEEELKKFKDYFSSEDFNECGAQGAFEAGKNKIWDRLEEFANDNGLKAEE